MHWFWMALIAPFLWSIVNHTDKFILSRYFKGGGAGGLMIFVGIVALPLAVIVYLVNPGVFAISGADATALISSGLVYNLAVFLYLYALEKDDASYIVPLWQLTPVFAYIFGILLLQEFISFSKILAGLVVLLGAVVLSIEFEEGRSHLFKKKMLVAMGASSALLALGYVIFKDSAINNLPFSVSMFWNQVGMLLFAVIFLLIKKYRAEFVVVTKQNTKGVLSLNIAEQAVETLGVFVNNFAILLAPAALVILIEYTAQPLFVFIEGIILTLLFPKFVSEKISRKHLTQKLFSIIIMAIGVYFVVV